jgi:hypothetical protein
MLKQMVASTESNVKGDSFPLHAKQVLSRGRILNLLLLLLLLLLMLFVGFIAVVKPFNM